MWLKRSCNERNLLEKWPVLFGEERAWESHLTRSVQNFKRRSSSSSIGAHLNGDVTPDWLNSSSSDRNVDICCSQISCVLCCSDHSLGWRFQEKAEARKSAVSSRFMSGMICISAGTNSSHWLKYLCNSSCELTSNNASAPRPTFADIQWSLIAPLSIKG